MIAVRPYDCQRVFLKNRCLKELLAYVSSGAGLHATLEHICRRTYRGSDGTSSQ